MMMLEFTRRSAKISLTLYLFLFMLLLLQVDGEFGAMIKLVPMTNEKVMNQINCFRTNGQNGSEFYPQPVLPDMTGFRHIATTNDKSKCSIVPCQVWKNVVNNTNIRQSIYTLYLIRLVNTNGTSNVIPVRYEMEGFNSLMDSHYDHYYIVYNVSV